MSLLSSAVSETRPEGSEVPSEQGICRFDSWVSVLVLEDTAASPPEVETRRTWQGANTNWEICHSYSLARG